MRRGASPEALESRIGYHFRDKELLSLALTHVSADLVADKEAARRAVAAYERASARGWPRSREHILRFFDGFELVEPGLVPKPRWRPLPDDPAADLPDISWAGVGKKL